MAYILLCKNCGNFMSDNFWNDCCVALFWQLAKKLKRRQMEALVLEQGLFGPRHSIQSAAWLLGISRSNVQRIEEKIRYKLKIDCLI